MVQSDGNATSVLAVSKPDRINESKDERVHRLSVSDVARSSIAAI